MTTERNKYETLFDAILEKSGMSSDELNRLINLARLWHNPLNVDNGKPLKEKYGWGYMFTDVLRSYGINKRYYFNFHGDIDMTDVDAVYVAYRDSKAFKRYTHIWREWAPIEFNSNRIFLLALVSMSVKGFKHEEAEAQRYRDEGCDVRKSTHAEDLKGIDLWVDGEPVQIKSPATQRMIDKEQ